MADRTPTKFDRAVGKAREKDTNRDDTSEVSIQKLANPVDSSELALDVERLAELMKSGDFEAAEQFLTIEPGMMVEGQLLGSGTTTIESMDPEKKRNGILQEMPTFQMRLTSGARVSILGAAQLARMLPQYLGRKGNTVIARAHNDRKLAGGKNMGEYFVMGPKPSAPRFIGEETKTASGLVLPPVDSSGVSAE